MCIKFKDSKKRDEFIREAQLLRDDLRREADNLDKHHENVNKARVVGSSVSAVGSALAITGAILAPFTAGTSLLVANVAAAGVALSTAGSFASSGASLFKSLNESTTRVSMDSRLRRLQDLCDDPESKGAIRRLPEETVDFGRKEGVTCEKATETARDQWDAVQTMYADIGKAAALSADQAQNVVHVIVQVNGKQSANIIAKLSCGTTKVVSVTGKEAAKIIVDATGKEAAKLFTKCTGKEASKALVTITRRKTVTMTARAIGNTAAKNSKTASKVSGTMKTIGKSPIVLLNVASLGLSVYDIASASTELQKGTKSQTGDGLRMIANKLDLILDFC